MNVYFLSFPRLPVFRLFFFRPPARRSPLHLSLFILGFCLLDAWLGFWLPPWLPPGGIDFIFFSFITSLAIWLCMSGLTASSSELSVFISPPPFFCLAISCEHVAFQTVTLVVSPYTAMYAVKFPTVIGFP